ncbi:MULTISPECIES: RNA polymerase sigma factor [Pedobacter]|uniref:RNA polymerase sigma-70 factor n=1 Tax=Pedobacter heparinus (strain ATCC 13125 / DSM 2366 / CIP 104194 / JCM 7457 / NBRC 12017 / NCIMB 9290 / NRRL B-14731 / HIM 762-3) TaxID=485917 RepID=C6XYZ7_PEDHD|nr:MULTISPECIES: RNA polymerase sigma-70 factor [Pedobacter]ACU02479.1 RNA polymerase sigma-70 factor [Pedobacter heparinus DSM 2366]MBB5440166.1 RNA polymerase sigma-70 factor (ECF subfamily) [Pedobacter sp. AK017]
MEREYARLNEEDQKLVNAIVQRDKKLFEVLYKKYYQQLFAVAYRYVGQAEIAEEIVHDVFITIWNKADQLNIQHSMKSYLFKSIVNSSLNFIKKEKVQAEKQQVYMAIVDKETADEPDTDREEALLKDLAQALELLPDKCRQVMYLSRFGKLKQQEIATQMNISIKTVKNHLTYGFQKLREQLEKRKHIAIVLFLLLNILTP